MFTGLVEAMGRVVAVEREGPGARLRIAEPTIASGLKLGESVAINGVCLTVVNTTGESFDFEAGPETLARTNLGELKPDDPVNLERALAVGDRLGGHIVQGHVDGVGTVRATRAAGDAWLIDLEVPPAVASLLVPLGSVAVDGVSLTVNALPAVGILQLSIIEHTMRHTTLGERQPGDRVHLEADILAKYLQRLAAPLLTS
jgi:riboflavin synthase